MKIHRRVLVLAGLLCLPPVALAGWTQADREALARACTTGSPALAGASEAEVREVCACVAHVITFTVSDADADDLRSRGEDAAARLLARAIEPCAAARAVVAAMPAETAAERHAQVARLKRAGEPLPRFHGWDAESSDGYLTDCETAARRSWPTGSERARRRYCRCTLSALGSAFPTRARCEAALRGATQGTSPPQEAWTVAAHLAACAHYAQRR